MKKELSIEELQLQNEELANRLEEAEQLIEAIKAGEVDAFAMNRNNQPQIFTLESGDYGYRMLVENITEGALTLSEDSLIVYTNSYFHELLSLPYEQVIGKPIFNFIHPASKETFNELFKKGLAGQSKGEINLTSANKIITVYVSLTSLYPTLQTVGMIVTDLTEKKKQEKVLDKNKQLKIEKKLIAESKATLLNAFEITQKQQRLYETVTNNTPDLVYVFDLNYRFTYANKALLTMWGQTWECAIGKGLRELGYEEWHAKMHEDEIDTVVATKQTIRGTVSFPHATLGKRIYDYIFAPVLNKEGEVEAITGTTRDITDIKLAEEAIQKSENKYRELSASLEEKVKRRTTEIEEKNVALEKMNKELQSFAYISSHDLQEPLRKIQTFATRIIEKEQDKLSDNAKEQFTRMQSAARRMQTLIEDLLAYSRTNTSERKFENTDLKKIVEEVKEDLKEELKEKHATIEASELCYADIIPFQFRQLMHNLIGNSLKFSNPGQPTHIKIKSQIAKGIKFNNEKLSPENKYCHISITDNGIGFEQQYSEKIFEVFQRLHGKNEYTGTGIGLSIVKKIVENHKGTITAESELGKGAKFDIYIPAT